MSDKVIINRSSFVNLKSFNIVPLEYRLDSACLR